MLITFFTALYDENLILVDNKKEIAKRYLQGWFLIDVLAIIPFEYVSQINSINGLLRFSKITKIWRLVKLARLTRIFQILKNKSKIMKIFTDFLKIGLGFERLLFVILLALIGIHIVTCLWILFPIVLHTADHINETEEDKYDDDHDIDSLKGTWLHSFKEKNYTDT